MTLARRPTASGTNEQKKWKRLCFLLFCVSDVCRNQFCGLNAACTCCLLTRKKRGKRRFFVRAQRDPTRRDFRSLLSSLLTRWELEQTHKYLPKIFFEIFWTSFLAVVCAPMMTMMAILQTRSDGCVVISLFSHFFFSSLHMQSTPTLIHRRCNHSSANSRLSQRIGDDEKEVERRMKAASYRPSSYPSHRISHTFFFSFFSKRRMIKNGEKTCSGKKMYVYKSHLGVFSFAERRERRVKRKLCALAVDGYEVHLVSASYEGNSSSYQTDQVGLSRDCRTRNAFIYIFAMVSSDASCKGFNISLALIFRNAITLRRSFLDFSSFLFPISASLRARRGNSRWKMLNYELMDARVVVIVAMVRKKDREKKHRVAANHDQFFNYNCCCCCWVKSPQGTRELLNVAAREEKNTIIIAKRKVIDAQQRTQSKTWCTYCDDKN